MTPCECSAPHGRRRVVLTGGPGAGKTALTVLPEAASIGFGGGFAWHSDARWEEHRRRWLIESSVYSLDKAARSVDVLRVELPECCCSHEVPSVRDRVHQHLSGGQSRKS